MTEEFKQFESKRMIYFAAALVIVFIAGMAYTWSVLQTPFVQHLNAQEQVGTIALCWTVTVLFATMSPTVLGGITKRFTPRQLVFIGGIMFGLGYLGCGYITSIPMLFIVFGCGVGIGSGLMYPTMMGYAASILPDKQGLASGLMAGVYGGSAIVFSPIFANLLQQNYSRAFTIIGPFALVVLVVASFFIGPIPDGYVVYKRAELAKQAAGTTAAPTSNAPDLNRGQMVRTITFYVALATFGLGMTSGMMIISQASKILQDSFTMTPIQAAGYVSLFSFASMIGRLFWGMVTDKANKYVTLCIICAIPIATMGFMAVNQSQMTAIVCMFLTALCYGGFSSTITPITADLFGTKHIIENYGVMYLTFGIAGLIGPRLAVTLNQGGNYSRAFIGGCIIAAISLVCAFIVRGKVKSLNS